MSDELKGATELLNAYADEFADATIGENTELTSNMQRRLSDAIRVVLAALAKREAVAEVSPEWIEIGHKIASDCASDVSFDYTGATPLWQRHSYQPRVWWSWGNFIAREVGGQWNLIERSKGGDRMVFSHEYFQEVQAHAAMLAASQQAAKGEGT